MGYVSAWLRRKGLWHIAFAVAALPAVYYASLTFFNFLFRTGSTATDVLLGLILALLSSLISLLLIWRLLGAVHVITAILVLGFLCGMASIPLHGVFALVVPTEVFDNPVFGGGVFEELMKDTFILLFALGAARHFCGAGAGVAIGWFIGMGFEFLENVSYMRLIYEAGISEQIPIRLIGGALNGHPLDTGLAGAIIGLFVSRSGRWGLVWGFPLALLPGMALHMLNNSEAGYFAALGIGLVAVVLLVTVAVRIARRHRAEEAQLMEEAPAKMARFAGSLPSPRKGRRAHRGPQRDLFSFVGQLAGVVRVRRKSGQDIQPSPKAIAEFGQIDRLASGEARH